MHFDTTEHKAFMESLLNNPSVGVSMPDVELVAALKRAVREASCGVKGQHPDSEIRISGKETP